MFRSESFTQGSLASLCALFAIFLSPLSSVAGVSDAETPDGFIGDRGLGLVPDTPQTGDLCSQNGGKRGWSTETDENLTKIRWWSNGCEVEVQVIGEIEFGPDFRTLSALESGGSFSAVTEIDGDRTTLVVTALPGGTLSFEWGRDIDAESEDWIASLLEGIFRNTPFMSEARAQVILQRGGLIGLRAELERMPSKDVQAAYMGVALESTFLSTDQKAELLAMAEATITSPSALAGLLVRVPQQALGDPAILDASLRVFRKISLNSERLRVLEETVLLGSARPEDSTVLRFLEESRSIESSSTLATFLIRFADRYPLEPVFLAEYFRAVDVVGSSSERARILRSLLADSELAEPALLLLIEVASRIGSDSEKSEVLEEVIDLRPEHERVRSALRDAVETIGSERVRERLLARLSM